MSPDVVLLDGVEGERNRLVDRQRAALLPHLIESGLVELASRADVRRHYDRLMEAKVERIAELKNLVASAGIELDGSDGSIQQLNGWFRANVERDPASPDRPRGRWFCVTQDIALYFGELLIARFPHLRWELGKGGKRNISFQRPVLVGFTKAHPSYDVDMDWALGQYAYDSSAVSRPTTTSSSGCSGRRPSTPDERAKRRTRRPVIGSRQRDSARTRGHRSREPACGNVP